MYDKVSNLYIIDWKFRPIILSYLFSDWKLKVYFGNLAFVMSMSTLYLWRSFCHVYGSGENSVLCAFELVGVDPEWEMSILTNWAVFYQIYFIKIKAVEACDFIEFRMNDISMFACYCFIV